MSSARSGCGRPRSAKTLPLHAYALVANAKRDPRLVRLLELDRDPHLRAGVLDRVVDEIGHDHLQLVLVPEHVPLCAVGPRFPVGQRLGGQPIARPRQRQALLHEGADVHGQPVAMADARADLPGAQDLIDRDEQPIAVLQHRPVELLALCLVHVVILEGLQVELQGRHGRLQFVGHGIDERLVLVVPPDFANQEDGIENDAGDDEGKHENAEEQQSGLPPADNDPADVEGERPADDARPEDDEEGDRAPAPARSQAHAIKDRTKGVTRRLLPPTRR